MPLTPEDVQNKRFTVVRFKTGYDEEEVDNFLDEVEEEIRRLVTTNKSLNNAGLRAPEMLSPAAVIPRAARPEPAAPVAPPPPPPAAVAALPPAAPPMPELVLDDNGDPALRTLMMAQRTAEEAISKAHADAQEILNTARAKATALEKDLRIAHAGRLAALEQERTGLIEEIAALRGFEREFRTRLRSYLSDLDARPSVEPAPKQAAPVVPPGAVPATGRHAAERPTGELPSAAAGPQPGPPRGAPPAPPAPSRPVAPPASAPAVAPPAAPGPFSPAPPAAPGFVSQPVPPPSGPPTQA